MDRDNDESSRSEGKHRARRSVGVSRNVTQWIANESGRSDRKLAWIRAWFCIGPRYVIQKRAPGIVEIIGGWAN